MKNPIVLMTAITGKPDATQIENYIKSVHDRTIDEILLYPRSGCELEYLSDEWFDTIKIFIDISEKYNISIWLYDEFNWPSGDAGGRVTINPEFRLKAIYTKGENKGQITTGTANEDLFNVKYYPDLLSDDAVDIFINSTYEKYFKKFGQYFGNRILGFFTDEPSFGYCCFDNCLPYYDGIKEEYSKAFSRNYESDLENNYKFFCKNVYRIVSERFYNCYIAKLSSWCKAHSVLLTGHLFCDSEPRSATKNNGDFLSQLSSFDIPGIDEIATPLNKQEFYKYSTYSLFTSIEYAANDNGAMAELFALGPCDMSYAQKTAMLYFASCFKVNRYFMGVSPLDLRGNSKITDYFNCISADQPDFDGMKDLSAEAKQAAELSKKDFTPDVYIKYPYEIFAQCLNGEFLSALPFNHLLNELVLRQIQFKFINNEDSASDAPIISFNDKMQYLFNGLVTDDKKVIASYFKKPPTVTDINGNLPDGIFVRKYDDGTFVVINLFGEADTYLINNKEICLNTHGVYISSTVPKTFKYSKPLKAEFFVEYLNKNIIRHFFLSEERKANLYFDDDMTVNFAVRNDAIGLVNDEILRFNKPDNSLPSGLKDLYLISTPQKFKCGKNELYCDKDSKYLPGMFIIGDFTATPNMKGENFELRLSERKNKYKVGQYIRDYGKINFTTKVKIPLNAKAIEIKGTTLYTILFANDNMLGEKIFSPFVYEIPTDLQGKKVNITILQCSSIAPIFSDINYYEQHGKDIKWKGTPTPQDIKYGFNEINWLY
ncbi:MAG: hypothetical protein E7568_06005 [Ruminococcaceae bacterium]|nr:hypothetical protein [Oscillospiraceae bacterium]